MAESKQSAELYLRVGDIARLRESKIVLLISDSDDPDISTNEIIHSLLEQAQCVVEDHLKDGGYDTEAIFKINAPKLPRIKLWIEHLFIYNLYLRANQMEMPREYKERFNETMLYLREVACGKASVKAPRRETDPSAGNVQGEKWNIGDLEHTF